VNRERCIELLGKLVSIDSVNPSLSPDHGGEEEIAGFLFDFLKKKGLDVEEQTVKGNRHNIIGRITGREEGPALLFVAHMDTVGVDEMTIPPFHPRVEGNKLFGRGSADTKGGMTAVLMAIENLVKHLPRKGELIFAATVDEEYEARGAETLVKKIKADGAVVMEPVNMTVVIGHKGFLWYEFKVGGRAAHGSDYEGGIDSIVLTGKLLGELARMNERLQSNVHPLVGPPSLHASQIVGGEGWSTYPALCTLRVERRTIPGEESETVKKEFEGLVNRLRREGIQISGKAVFHRDPTMIGEGEKIVQCIRSSARSLGIECPIGGMGAWPEAGILNKSGIPSVVFGPSGCKGHEAEEFVLIDSVIDCARVLEGTFRRFAELS